MKIFAYRIILIFLPTLFFVSFMGVGQLPMHLPEIVSNSSGYAVTNIPLDVPDGTRGLTPGLSLSYNSGMGRGLLGRGWSLSGIGTIKRDISYGIQYSSSDHYLSSEYGKLVDSLGNRSIYYTQEESFLSFYPQSDSGQGATGFIAYDKEGTRYTFGGANARLAHPNGAIRTWGLSEIREPHGEMIQYEWAINQGELYPTRINYAGGQRYIEFEYENRSDAYSDYKEKVYTLRNWRLKRIRFYSNNSLVHSYILSYGNDPSTGDSLLTKIEYKKNNLLSLSTHLPLEFSYTPSHAGIISKLSNGATSLSTGFGEEIDMVDRGFQMLIELLFVNEVKKVASDLNGFIYDPNPAGNSRVVSNGFETNAMNVGVNRYNPDIELIGRFPLGNQNRTMCNIGPLACLCSAFPQCSTDIRVTCGTYVVFGMDGCNNGFLTPLRTNFATDINGDGISEYSRFLGKMDGDQVYIRTDDFSPRRSFDSPKFPIKYNTYYDWADIDGDGRSDFLFEKSGILHISFSNGSGLDPAIAYPNILLLPAAQNYTRTAVYEPRDYAIDINSDGRADFIHFYDNRMSVHLSQGRGFQAERILWHNGIRNPIYETKATSPFLAHRMNIFADIDGDGIPEHLHIVNVNPPSEQAQLNALEARHNQELVQADAERQAYKEQISHIISGGGATEADINALSLRLHPDQRGLYWDLVSRPGEATQTERDQLFQSVDRQFSEEKLKEIYERQANEMNQEIERIKSADLSNARYDLFITKLILSENRLVQYSQTIPKEHVGFNGKNWLVDVNKDGLLDLISLTNRNSHVNPYDYGKENPNTLDNKLKVMLNTGGQFNTNDVIISNIPTVIKPDRFAKQDDPYSKMFQSFDFIDMNSDGSLDFVLTQLDSGTLHVYNGNSNGSFAYNNLSFSVESKELTSILLDDRNDDGIPDLYYQFGKTESVREILSDSPSTGGLLKSVQNGVSGAEATITYNWKKSVPNSVLKGTGNYDSSLPNRFAQMVVTNISFKKGVDLPLERTDYSYFNARYKPGDLETGVNLGFESITERNYINGGFVSRVVTSYNQSPNYAGLISARDIYAGNDTLTQSDSYAYAYYNPHAGTRLKLPVSSTTLIYENGSLKDQKAQSITYSLPHAYKPSIIEDTWNGRITRKEFSYQPNQGLNILAQPVDEKTYINGSLSEQNKFTYSGFDVSTKSELVGNNEWYTTIYTYDGIGNISTTTDSLGRTLSYEYNDLTRSKQTVLRNALGQTTITSYDPMSDLEICVEDSNGNKEESEYDIYGRKTKTIVNGDNLEGYDYTFNGSLFITTKTTFSSEGDVWVKETRDVLDQILKTESLAVDGYILTEESKFDQRGREIQKSNRYLTGDNPVWTFTTYYNANEDTSERPKQVVFYTGEITNFTYGLRTVTSNTTFQSDNIRSEESTVDEFGQLVTRIVQGEALRFSYNPQGKITRIIDPGNSITTIQYDIGGRKVSQTDSNSGTTNYTYNVAGEMLSQKDSRGVFHHYEIDYLGRITKLTAGSETPIIYEYDNSNSISTVNMAGRLSKVSDETGITEFAYDAKGNIIIEKRTLDDLQIIFQKTYDVFNRIKTIKYPEGTVVRSHYNGIGQLSFLTMDSHDGNSLNHTVVSYEGPKKDGSQYYLERKTGNGVLTRIEIDPIRLRPITFYTKLKDNTLEQSIRYHYDNRGNLLEIQDNMNESRNQIFIYDHLNRVSKAIGKYGEEEYAYHPNGNLLKKGAFSYNYESPNHIHSVTKVSSLNTGILNYSYDEVGNMVQRNGDNYHYNAQGKLKEIITSGGDRFEYKYDYSGNRIKKSLLNLGTVTYDFGNIYEIHRNPGLPDKHTMFIIGTEGDLIAQYTRDDANLITSVASNGALGNLFCKDITIDCNTYWKNRIDFHFFNFLSITNIYSDGKLQNGHRAIPWILLAATLIIAVYRTRNEVISTARKTEWIRISKTNFRFSFLTKTHVSFTQQLPRYIVSLLLLSFSFTVTAGCFPLLMGAGEGESGTPIWMLGLANIPVTTPSVSEESYLNGNGNGGSIVSGSARVSGMYFYHPDHLGSITMITDGNGNVLAGGERGGKSHITYKPYGEILRTDSYGPDITKFKYTGQEEDRESGLYYYKARYYDPLLGKFLANDSMIFPKQIQGLNRSMYAEGNPIGNRDPSGNKPIKPLTWAIAGYLLAPENQRSEYAGLLFYFASQKREQNRRKEAWINRQIINPIMRMNTAQLVIGAIAVAAGFYTGAYVNEGIRNKCAERYGQGYSMGELGPRELCGLVVGGGTSLIFRTVSKSLVKETAILLGDKKNVEKYLNTFSEGYYTGGLLTNFILVPTGGIGNIGNFSDYALDVEKLSKWYTYPMAGASYFLGKELDKIMKKNGIQQ